MIKTKAPKVRFLELLTWILSAAIIMPLAWIVVFVSIFMLDSFVHPLWEFAVTQALLFIICGTIAGCIVGGSQWLVLRKNVGWANHWFRATVVSWSLTSVAWWLEYRSFGGPYFEISQQAVIPAALFTSLVSGVILGTAQWSILRQKVDISPFWVLVTAASWFIAAGATIITIACVVTKPDPIGYTYFPVLLMPGAIVGLGTGLARPKLVGRSHDR
jgi:hypothetical protein